MWGYGFATPNGNATGAALARLRAADPIPPPTEIVVTTLADGGDGSLREALGDIADGGTITFDPGLAGGTIGLTTGQLLVDRDVVVDASAAPGLIVSGSGSSRVFQVDAGATVAINDVMIADGAAARQGGGVLNYGSLSRRVVVVTTTPRRAPVRRPSISVAAPSTTATAPCSISSTAR